MNKVFRHYIPATTRRLLPNRWDLVAMPLVIGFLLFFSLGAEQTFGAFCSKESYFDVLTKAGINVVELTGNHNNDYGYADNLHTLDLYRVHGIQTSSDEAPAAQKS